MSRKGKDKLYDRNLAVGAADSFRAHSEIFIRSVGDDLNEAQQRIRRDMGGLVASATMLALALELYLKALHISIHSHVPEGHHLWTLYKGLPNDLKQSLEAQYNHANTGLGLGKAVEHRLTLVAVTKPDEIPGEDDGPFPEDSRVDLKSVLVRSSDAFITWRYLHEGGKKGVMVYYRYEFYRLGLICDVIRKHILDVAQLTHKQS